METIEPTHSPSDSAGHFDYQLLRGHEKTDGSYKTDEQLRLEYIQRTDELIHKMTGGIETTNATTGERELRKPDTVIFLDKSARPVAWLASELWNKLATDEDGNTPKKPDFRFLNIDREQWVNVVDPDGSGRMDISKIDDSIIRSLRSVFTEGKYKQDGLTPAIDAAPSMLDNKTVMVVDEVYSTGRTLNIATSMIKRAFPTATVEGTYWMSGIATKGTAIGNADLPVWYKEDSEYGRGIANRLRDPGSSKSANLTQRLGGWFLSTRFATPDLESLQLRRELHQLANDPNIPVRISANRYNIGSDEEFEKYKSHMERVNNGRPFSETQLAITAITHVKKQ